MAKRYRSRPNFAAIADNFIMTTVYGSDNIAPLVQNYGLIDVLRETETIVDVPHGFGSMNPCSHQKIRYTMPGTPPPFLYGTTRYLRNFWICTMPTLYGPSGSQLNDFAWAAFLNATTQVPDEVSIPNFLLDLGSMKDLMVKWAGNLIKYISSGYLALEFGWKPLLSDLAAIFGAVKAAKKRLKHLRDTYGKPTRILFRRGGSGPVDSIPTVPTSLRGPFADTALVGTKVVRNEYVLTSTCIVYHELKGLDSASALLDVLASMTGFQNPIKVIWDKIPFSFVLEYVINLGHLLDQCKLASFTGEIQLKSACWSISQDLHAEGYVREPEFGTNPNGDGGEESEGEAPPLSGGFYLRQVGYIFAKNYVRSKGLPLGASVFLTDGLTSYQLGILAALLAQALSE